MKYLHLINDTLFTDFVIELFEHCNPGNNTYLIGTNDPTGLLKNTKLNENVHVRMIRSKAYYHFIQRADFDVLVIHFMHDFKAIALNKLKKTSIVVWLVWGGDILGKKIYKGLYQPHTQSIVSKLYPTWKQNFKSSLRNLYYFITTGVIPSIAYRKAVRKVNYCATVIPDEFTLLSENWDFFCAKQVPFAYATIENNLKHISENDQIDGSNILIGNSIDATSNHLDVLNKLKELSIGDRRLILPLNYGEGLEYRKVVLEIGQQLFGGKFKPIVDILAPQEYVDILKTCSVAIMNHERQQAVGNLISLLWLGSKVFMSENSIAYAYFKRKGFKIFSFQSDLSKESIEAPLTTADIMINRQLLRMEYGRDVVFKKTKTLLDIVNAGVTVKI